MAMGDRKGYDPSNSFRNRQMVRNVTVLLENSRTFLLVEIKVFNFIGKPFNFAPLH